MENFFLKSTADPPRVLGHRGAMALCPENTMISFQTAAERGATIIEFDVHLTRDGRAVVIHDETLDRTTSGSGLVRDHTASQLKTLDAGQWFSPDFAGEKIPLLEEVLEFLKQRDLAGNIEIKNGPVFYEGIEDVVAKEILLHGEPEKIVVSSFDHTCLARLHEKHPEIITAVLTSSYLHEPVAYLERLGARGLHPRWTVTTGPLVQLLHENGFFVCPWVVNDRSLFERFRDWGVDAVGTNDPGVLPHRESGGN